MVSVEQALEVISDIRTYSIMSQNENYRDRLYEAYEYIKSEGIQNLDDFKSRTGLLVGAFTYSEMTIFDRIKDEEYLNVIKSALFNINNHRQEYIDNPRIGDSLARWGKLGNTSHHSR